MIAPSITETQIFTALRAFILSIVDCEVVRTPVNRAAMPKGDFIALSPSTNAALSTDVSTYTSTNQNIKRSTQFNIQIDCYGSGAGDRATVISMLLRHAYGCDQFTSSGFDIQPLYAGDAQQMPLVDGENQYEERWTFEAAMQFNPVVTFAQQSATALAVGVKDVDRMYPP